MIRHIVFGAVAVLINADTSVGKDPLRLDIRLEPTTLTTRAFDPIVLRVTFENPRETTIEGTADPTPANGLLKFEVRKKGDSEYRRTVSRTENLSSLALRVGTKVLFSPNEERTTIAVIAENHKIKVFDGSGRYELRAVIVDSDELTGLSQPIDIHVVDSPTEHLRAAEKASRVVARETGGGISYAAKAEALRIAVEALEDCELKRIGTFLADVVDIRDANTRDSFALARQRVEQNRKHFPSPMQDWISVTLVSMYFQLDRLDLAQEETRRLPKASFERRELEHRIRERRTELSTEPPAQ